MTNTVLSLLNSPIVSLLMILVLVLHAPGAGKESKRMFLVFILLLAAFLLMLIPDFLYTFQTGKGGSWFYLILPTIKLVLIISALVFVYYSLRILKIKNCLLQEKFHKVFNTTPHAMVINTVSDGIIHEVNSAFVRISGKTAEEVIGKTAIGLGMYYKPEQRDEMISILKANHKVGPIEMKFNIRGAPRKFLYSAQLIIIRGEQFLIAHIEEKDDNSQIGDGKKNLLKTRLNDIMATQALFKNPGLSLHELAEKLETNRTYLSQTINSEYENFSEYVNRLRVIEACRIIQNGLDPRLSIDHVYSLVGFASRTTFYAAFKKYTGVSPSRFRKMNDPEVSLQGIRNT